MARGTTEYMSFGMPKTTRDNPEPDLWASVRIKTLLIWSYYSAQFSLKCEPNGFSLLLILRDSMASFGLCINPIAYFDR